MPQKSTKYSLQGKKNIFTKRKIILGITIIALVGVGYILISKASDESSVPTRQEIYCIKNNRKCAAVPFAGAQKIMAYVKLDTACSTNQSWATAVNMIGNWKCLQRVASTNPIPTGSIAIQTPCYIIPMPTNTRNSSDLQPQINGSPNDCLRHLIYDVNTPLLATSSTYIRAFVNTSDSPTQAADKVKAEIRNNPWGYSVTQENNNYDLGGKKAIRFVEKSNSDSTNKILHIFVEYPKTLNNIPIKGLWLLIPGYDTITDRGIIFTKNANTMLNNWQWR